MGHRTDPTRADEALRQARIDAPIRDSLRWIAHKLTDRRPEYLMTDAARLAIALRAACEVHPNNNPAAEQLERDLLTRMPHVDRPITRGEYALLLNKKTWSA